MNIIETAKAILHGDADIDPMEVVRAVATLEPLAVLTLGTPSEEGTRFYNLNKIPYATDGWPSGQYKLYTLEADK